VPSDWVEIVDRWLDPLRGCPACADRRYHTAEETRAHHPYSGHGYTREQGWTHPDLKAAVEKSKVEQAEKQSEAKP
jgi:hypothetical protein